MTLEQLVENAVLADLNLVPQLAALLPKPRDHEGRLAGDDEPGDDEATITLSVSATDQGDAYPGTGIKRVHVELELRANGLAEDEDGTRASSLLDPAAELCSDRLQPSTTIAGVVGRESAFSNSSLLVGRIKAAEANPREEEDLIRIRRIARVFEAAQL